MDDPISSAKTSPRPSLPRRGVLAAVLLSIIFSSPSLDIGFFLDDYHQIALIEGQHDFDKPALNLYGSFLDFSDVPWWTADEARTGFWRPLSSALLYLDYELFGRDALLWHVHSLLWLAALIVVISLLFRGLPKFIGVTALILFALDESHAMTAGVLCNRHALVTAVPAFLALWAHLQWREHRWGPGRWMSPLLFAFALGFGETTIPVMAYVLAYELFVSEESKIARLSAIAPTAALAGAYVIAYAIFELGPRGVLFYLNPLEEPLGFISALLLHIPALLASGFAALPSGLWLLGPPMTTLLVSVGIVATALVGIWLWRSWDVFDPDARRLLPMWMMGSLGALPPLASTLPSDRQLLVPAVGFSVMLAFAIDHCRRALFHSKRGQQPIVGTSRDIAQRRFVAHKRFAGTMGVLLLLLHVGVAGAARLQMQWGTAKLGRQIESIPANLSRLANTKSDFDRASEAPDLQPPVRFLVAFAPDFFTAIYAPVIWDHNPDTTRLSWNVITATPVRQKLKRTGDRTLEARSLDGRYLRARMERFFKLQPDVTIEGGIVEPNRSTIPLRVEILETRPPRADDPLDDQMKTLPVHLRFTVETSLDESWHLVTWKDGKFVELEMPDIGEEIIIEPHPGLMAIL